MILHLENTGTPVFFLENTLGADRIFGATFFKKENRWYFPAFPPFLDNVLEDLRKVYPDLTLSDNAATYVANKVSEEETINRAFTLPVIKPRDHQLFGLGKLLHNYRYILKWKPGTGKTKVIIDTVNELRQKTLVLCPSVAIDNWKGQIALYGNNLRSLSLTGASVAKKKSQLQEAIDTNPDFLLVSYDTARLYGFPTVDTKALKVAAEAGMSIPKVLKDSLSRIRGSNDQCAFVASWIRGKPLKEVIATIDELLVNEGPQYLTDYKYEIFVADESHRVKRIQSGRTKVAMKLSALASRRYLLSGTLSQGDPRDLYPQLKILAPYVIPENWMQFMSKFVEVSRWNKHIVTGYKNLHILNARVEKISCSKTLEECVDIPSRSQEYVMYDLSPAQVKDYNYAVKEYTIELDNGIIQIANAAVRLNKLLQICSGFVYKPTATQVCDTCSSLDFCVHEGVSPGSLRCTNAGAIKPENETVRYPQNPKLRALEDLLTDLLEDESNKVIIWAVFKAEMDDLEALLKNLKIGYVRLDGSNSNAAGKQAETFEEDSACRVFLGQIKTGISITLNAAQYMIYYSRSWSLDDWEQSMDRNYRIGQTKKTVVYRLCAANTVEVQQLLALDNRQDIAKTLMSKVDCFICDDYARCLKTMVEPWTSGCILQTSKRRKTAVVKELPQKG